jgi:hypothetical protein
MNNASITYSSSYKVWLWLSIFAVFLVLHTPKDKIAILSEHSINFIFDNVDFVKGIFKNKASADWNLQQFIFRIKRIIFLISIIILFYPLLVSLKRADFLWDSQKFKHRLIMSGTIFLFLSLFVFPVHLEGAGSRYALMSISPFEASSGWYYRRILMPAIANFLGFQGYLLYYIYSMAINFMLIFFVIAYFEHEGVKINFLHLLSIASSSFVIFNFMLQGFADPLMCILLLMALFVVDHHESRLAITALTLAAHEGSVFILVPLLLFVFPRKDIYQYFLVIAMYFGLYVLSYHFNAINLVESHNLIDNKIGIGWAMEYPLRAVGGWFFAYKLLWIIIAYAVFKMFKTHNTAKAVSVVSIIIVAPLIINILTVDVYRNIAGGFLGLLICYSFLMKSGYGKAIPLNAIMVINILIPSIYVGTNNGFRPVPGLYGWLYKFIGLHKLLGNI